ncbi:M48 family metallopeptidase [Neisseria montereyensis]|uniref:M48 family metallopeptidase n=1 Tax=Neisseria montereyensis TaxID=2973938 RepID=A0ABT2FF73_9NEIS|nr:SprT family zinc-dependent metalloprotease [Neisseria montereyensis]MCS4534153.1 M48 family metallopeptidase [Neisseria montereyensis]
MRFTHTLSDGLNILIELKRSAKKNIILRPLSTNSIRLNIPPYVNSKQLQSWLRQNEAILRKTLSRAPTATVSAEQMPEHILYRGAYHKLNIHNLPDIYHAPPNILLPDIPWPQQKTQLRHYLTERAAEILLPRLHYHAENLSLTPAAMALSNAKTFWGVCRSRTGIRLNWRLIGAPDFVIDYICIHELCHLPHPNHSKQFWAMVNHHTPHTHNAKQWLKQYGSELFLLDNTNNQAV